ncbi:MAG: ATP-grasp domain-containing protein [Gammaproteobacteria bacterium]|nr:ATP-grasp domain-containing protein [Gammaproteobacteria bacterium]
MSGSSAPPPGLSALAREGELMLHALGRGLSAMAGVRLVTVRDARLPSPDYPTALAWVRAGDDCAAVVGAALEDADAFWPVAPETGGLLAQFCRLARGGSCLLLNSPAPVVEKAGGKYSAFLRLRQNGVRCIETARLGDLRFPQDRDLVVKPDDGVGCESVRLLRAGESPPRGSLRGDDLCQPYLPGIAASLNVIYPSAGAPYIIGANRQEVTLDAPDVPNAPDAANAAKTPDAANAAHAANAPEEGGRFRLRACHVNALAREALGFEELAAGVQRSFPGIVGHVGIDLIVDGDNTLHLLEINPRVTTSFAGLAASTGLNPCAEVIRAVRGEACTPVSRRRFVPVEVRLDGAA